MIGGFGYGGTERLCLNLVSEMPLNIKHIVVGLDAGRTGMEDAFRAYPNASIETGRTPTEGRIRFLVWMWRLVRRTRPDGIIVHIFGVAHVLTALAARLAGVRAIAVAAGNPAPETTGRLKWRILIVLSRWLGVPVQSYSEWVEGSLRELGAALPAGSDVIYNGVDVARIAADAGAARAARRADDECVIGMVSRLDAIKDQATLIRAFALLPRQWDGRRLMLRLVGDGALRGELEALADGLGVANRVEFLGSRSDVAHLLGGFDIYAFSTTRDEGFGIALIEAMAAGLPIAATDVGPCREVLGDTACLVAPRDDNRLSQAISTLLSSEPERSDLGQRAYRRAREVFDIVVTASKWAAAIGIRG